MIAFRSAPKGPRGYRNRGGYLGRGAPDTRLHLMRASDHGNGWSSAHYGSIRSHEAGADGAAGGGVAAGALPCFRRRLCRLSHLLLGIRQRFFEGLSLGTFRLADRFLQRVSDRLIDCFR